MNKKVNISKKAKRGASSDARGVGKRAEQNKGDVRARRVEGEKPIKPTKHAQRSREYPSKNNLQSGQGLCPVANQCGACQTLDVPYAEQLASKQQRMEELFAEVAPTQAFQPILGMEDPYHYRNKVVSPYAPGRKLPGAAVGKNLQAKGGKVKTSLERGKTASKAVAQGARREVLTGMYAQGTHKLIPTDTCLLENEIAKRVTLVVRDLMRKWDIAPYNEDTGTGFMRHAVVRVGHESGEVLVTLVTNSDEFPSSKSFCRELVKRVPAITTVVQNVNLRQTNVILGEKERTLYGPGFILDTLCGLSFRISSRSFYQVNAVQTEVLYNTAINLAQLQGNETVIDAYCGTGTIGLVAASRGAGRVIGVDTVESAIHDARENARHNGIENAKFVAADAGEFMRDLARERADRLGEAEDLVLLMDPPRAGASEEFLQAAEELAPSRIVYISCNPETQARDVAHLARAGYVLETVQPVDMFPHTEHVENICLLTRRS